MAAAFKSLHLSANGALSTAASLAATTVLLRTVAHDLLPDSLRAYLSSLAAALASRLSPEVTAVVEELDGLRVDPLYLAAEAHLSSLVSPSVRRLRVSRRHPLDGPSDSAGGLLLLTVGRGEEVVDAFEGARFKWRPESSREVRPGSTGPVEVRRFGIRFHRRDLPKLAGYLAQVEGRHAAGEAAGRGLRIHVARYESLYENVAEVWRATEFRHPATFDTLAMDPEVKRAVVADLSRFSRRKEYYRRVGRAWKRGYLLHGPPGTGKSTLVAAMANFLRYDVYDLELAELSCNSELRKLLVATSGRSILVVEDIDCTVEVQNRDDATSRPAHNRVTLSGLLNFIDGLWSSCGEERIIVFTTNRKDRIDPALLRPGRMDMHIHMGYCSPQAFDVLANNYLGVEDHGLFGEIKSLLSVVEATPAEIAEELMRDEDTERALCGVLELLRRKKEGKGATAKVEHVDRPQA